MNRRYHNSFVLFLSFINLSFISKPQYAGLLTDGYDIVGPSDLEEDGQLSSESHFSNDEFEHHWFCVEPTDYFMNCKNTGVMEPEDWEMGAPSFWIRSDDQVYNIGTRRNWDIDHCNQMIETWGYLMKDESVVCISAIYLNKDGNRSEWIIDRMKTHKGEWSWFARGDAAIAHDKELGATVDENENYDEEQ